MLKQYALLIGLITAFALSSCSFFSPAGLDQETKPARCLPSFPDRDGWYGGDGAYSIALDNERSLWLFGDTFVSNAPGRKDRIGMDILLGNTLAVSTCSPQGVFNIRYYMKRKKGNFVSFFGEGKWYWPQDPFIANKILYIPLLAVRKLPSAEAPFNFKIVGHKLARIRDYQKEDPRYWSVDYLDWTKALPPGIEAPAPACAVLGNYVYFYALLRYTKNDLSLSGNILMRVPILHLDAPADHLEYLTGQQGWQKKWNPEALKILFPEGLSEMSVRYSASENMWLAVYLSPENKGNRLLYRTSTQAEGPWSAPRTLETIIDEVNPSNPRYNRQTFCYAGKEHRQFTRNKSFVVTYVCNSSAPSDSQDSFLRRHLFLYRPRVKVVEQP